MIRTINTENLLSVKYPKVAALYDKEKNDKPLSEITIGMRYKAWFTCPKCGCSFYCKIQSMFSDAEHCPTCRKNKLIPVREGRSLFDHKDWLQNWDYEKNKYNPKQLSDQSNRKCYWKCRVCGNEYQKAPNAIYRSYIKYHTNGCPKCGNKQIGETKRKQSAVLNGSLAQKRPDILLEWDYSKNVITPEEVAEKSNRKAWWVCFKGHSFCTQISNRTDKNEGCPYCAGQKLLKGFNDLETRYPEIAKEWDYERNKPVMPSDTMPNSKNKYYFICNKGHSYLCSVANRTQNTGGCPYCAHQKTLPEYIVLYYLEKYKLKFIYPYSPEWLNRGSFDIYLPEYKTIIEYDGERYHKNKISVDQYKDKICQEHGLNIIRFREYGLPLLNTSCCIKIPKKRNHDYKYFNMAQPIREMFLLLGFSLVDINIDIERDLSTILSEYNVGKY